MAFLTESSLLKDLRETSVVVLDTSESVVRVRRISLIFKVFSYGLYPQLFISSFQVSFLIVLLLLFLNSCISDDPFSSH